MQTLTDKKKAFCDAYLETGNGRQSAIAAGVSKKSAHSAAYEWLHKDTAVRDYLDSFKPAKAVPDGKAKRIKRLREVGVEAEGAGQYGAAVRAEEVVARIEGHLTPDKSQTGDGPRLIMIEGIDYSGEKKDGDEKQDGA